MRRLWGYFCLSFIGFCAASLSVQSRFMVQGNFSVGSLEGFVAGGAVLGYYGAHPNRLYRVFARLMGLGGAICLLFFVKSAKDVVAVAVPLAAWIAYYGGWLPGQYGLRSGLLAKPVTVAATWAWVTVLLPFSAAFWADLAPVFAERFAFVFALALAYDVTDIAYDGEKGFPTLARRLQLHGTLRWIYSGIAASAVFAGIAAWKGIYPAEMLFPLSISWGISGFWLSYWLRRPLDSRLQKVLIDFLIPLQCALVLLLRGE